jgi:PIF1-like helicase
VGCLLAEVDLIVWDEVPMQYRFAFEAVHRLLRDHLQWVPVLQGGDFAQTLPIVPRGNRAEPSPPLCAAPSYGKLELMTLCQNIRSKAQG